MSAGFSGAVLLPFSAMKRHLIAALTLALVACASHKESRIVDAATTPLRDLNVIRTGIPSVLREAQKRPYLVPEDRSCAALADDVRALDDVLGPDFDAPVPGAKPDLMGRGTAMVDDAAVGALQGAAESVVPFRSWVRKLTGAERHSKDVAAAVAAGTVRRAFLKGLRAARGCS
jgi:hypothetical protein